MPPTGLFGSTNEEIRVFETMRIPEQSPELLANQLSQRFSGDPPPYSEAVSTTEPSTPVHYVAPTIDIYESFPRNQFCNQVQRETDRLFHQICHERSGRRQTLPCKTGPDLMANAENNIRDEWVEQRIWRTTWGPAWPKNALPSDNKWQWSGKAPKGPDPFGCWAHEVRPKPLAPAASPPSRPKPKSRSLFGWQMPEEPSPEPELHPSAANVAGGLDASYEPKPSASRPLEQFRYQVMKELRWLADESKFRALSADEMEARAYTDVKNTWENGESGWRAGAHSQDWHGHTRS